MHCHEQNMSKRKQAHCFKRLYIKYTLAMLVVIIWKVEDDSEYSGNSNFSFQCKETGDSITVGR